MLMIMGNRIGYLKQERLESLFIKSEEYSLVHNSVASV
jgi:hypothetical protein